MVANGSIVLSYEEVNFCMDSRNGQFSNINILTLSVAGSMNARHYVLFMLNSLFLYTSTASKTFQLSWFLISVI